MQSQVADPLVLARCHRLLSRVAVGVFDPGELGRLLPYFCLVGWFSLGGGRESLASVSQLVVGLGGCFFLVLDFLHGGGSAQGLQLVLLPLEAGELLEEYSEEVDHGLPLDHFALEAFQTAEDASDLGLRLHAHIVLFVLQNEVQQLHQLQLHDHEVVGRVDLPLLLGQDLHQDEVLLPELFGGVSGQALEFVGVGLDFLDAEVVGEGGVLDDGFALGQQFVLLGLVPSADVPQHLGVDLNDRQPVELLPVLLHFLALKDSIDGLDFLIGGGFKVGHHGWTDHLRLLPTNRASILSEADDQVDGTLLGGILRQHLLELVLVLIILQDIGRGHLIDCFEVMHELLLRWIAGGAGRRGGLLGQSAAESRGDAVHLGCWAVERQSLLLLFIAREYLRGLLRKGKDVQDEEGSLCCGKSDN